MRWLVTILGIGAIIGVLAYVKWAQISSIIAAGETMLAAGPPPEAVSTEIARVQHWESSVATIGTIASSKGVAISTEVAGLVSAIGFDSGATVAKGAVLVQLDVRVEKAQLASALARRDLALTTVKRTRVLSQQEVAPAAELDADESSWESAAAEVEVLRAQIGRKTIRAPFAGKLGIREVDLGQYLAPGTTVTTLESVTGVYVDFDLPQQQQVALGMKIRTTVAGRPEFLGAGEVVAIDPTIDPVMRTSKIRATIVTPTDDDDFHPGMFVNVSLVRDDTIQVVAVPATAIAYATYGDSVFVVEPHPDGATAPDGSAVMVARQQFVRLGEQRGDYIAVREGISAGDEVVVAGAFKLRNNATVVVDNSEMLTASLDPRPVNR